MELRLMVCPGMQCPYSFITVKDGIRNPKKTQVNSDEWQTLDKKALDSETLPRKSN